MQTKVTKQELEKFRLSLKQHILHLETRNKELRRKQFFTEKLAEKLREQEQKLTERINDLIKIEMPLFQIASITINNGVRKSIKLYLN